MVFLVFGPDIEEFECGWGGSEGRRASEDGFLEALNAKVTSAMYLYGAE